MSEINLEETRKLEHLCQDATVVDARRCRPILCASENPDAGIEPQVPYPVLGKGDVCVATKFYPSGHSSPDCSCDTDKISGCPYRRPKEMETYEG